MTVTSIAREEALPVHQANALTGESPFWDDVTSMLWWIDIQGQRLLAFAPATGGTIATNVPSMPGLVARWRGTLVVGLEDGLHAVSDAGALGDRLVAVDLGTTRVRLNDGKVDGRGRLWLGAMEKWGTGEPLGALLRIDPDGSVHTQRSGLGVPNAICFGPDGKRFYFTDSRTKVVEVMDYDAATGQPGPPRTFVRYQGAESPDGACVDAAGALWIAVVNGSRIERLLPDGTLDLVVHLPVSRPTMPMLGGADRRTLFVTSQRRFLGRAGLSAEPFAGDLLAVRLPWSGPATCPTQAHPDTDEDRSWST